MRVSTVWWTVGLATAVALAAGCTVKEDAADDPSGEGGSGGAATDDAGVIDHGACGEVSVSGTCVDDKTLKTCVISDTLDEPERVLTSTCTGDRNCVVENGTARCKLLGECAGSETACSADEKTLRTCSGSGAEAKWIDTPCDTANGEKCNVGKPGAPAQCQYVPSSSSTTKHLLTGRIKFEYRPQEQTGWGDIKVAEGWDLYVGIFDGDEFIGAALSGYDIDTGGFEYDGSFKAYLSRAPTENTQVFVWPMVFNYTTGQPLMAVAKLAETDPIGAARSATEYWSWGVGLEGATTEGDATVMPDMLIPESAGSGALRIFQRIDAGLILSAREMQKDQMSLIVYWDPNTGTPTCGACFCGTQCGGGQVAYGSGSSDVDFYDSWIAIGGPSDDGQTHWSSSVVAHEFGHYLMANYSRSPGEGGPHYLASASKPGLAYSEAWATSYAQVNVGNPLYVDEQNGTVFWVDISKYTYYKGNLEMPDPNGPIDQPINENIAAGMIWKLWVDSDKDPDGRGLGDTKIFNTLTYSKLVDGTFNRGYERVDLVDFFDAAICSGSASEADVAAVATSGSYPYNPADKPCN